MNKIFIILIFIAMPFFCEEMTSELVPSSPLRVSFPSNWNFSKPYLGDGKYSSILIGLPNEEHGGHPMYPEFELEFTAYENPMVKYILKNKKSLKKIGGIKSTFFRAKNEVDFMHSNKSHSSYTVQVSGYLVPINKGYLICLLTTQSKHEHKKYIKVIEDYCTSAVLSSK